MTVTIRDDSGLSEPMKLQFNNISQVREWLTLAPHPDSKIQGPIAQFPNEHRDAIEGAIRQAAKKMLGELPN